MRGWKWDLLDRVPQAFLAAQSLLDSIILLSITGEWCTYKPFHSLPSLFINAAMSIGWSAMPRVPGGCEVSEMFRLRFELRCRTGIVNKYR